MLTPKQERFVDEYVNTNNATEATVRAGYNCKDRKTAKSIGHENLTKIDIKQAIMAKRVQIAEFLQDKLLEILTNLIDIAENPKVNDAIRVKALIDLLDRAGCSAKNIAKASVGEPIVLETRQTLEVAQRARELMIEKLKVRA